MFEDFLKNLGSKFSILDQRSTVVIDEVVV
jgi:hypothetical protein